MLAQSQGRNEQVVNSYNLFIDSAKDVGGAAGKGDSFSLQLGADSIQAQDGQFLRLTQAGFETCPVTALPLASCPESRELWEDIVASLYDVHRCVVDILSPSGTRESRLRGDELPDATDALIQAVARGTPGGAAESAR